MSTENKVFKLNVNSSVMVKLTDRGYQALADEYNECLSVVKSSQSRTLEHYKTEADKDGYTKFQLWRFIQVFGQYTGMGFAPCYETEIRINESALEIIGDLK